MSLRMNVPIVYFSASGNTQYVARLIRNGLKLAGFQPELIRLTSVLGGKKKLDYEEITALGIGAPVYGMALTPNILSWIKDLPEPKTPIKLFLFDTNAGLPGKPLEQVGTIIKAKNFHLIGALEIIAPTRDSVFEFKFFENLKWSRAKIERAFHFGRRLGAILKKGEGSVDWSRPTPGGSLMRALFKRVEKPIFKLASRLFQFNADLCIQCKACKRNCPTNAITFEDEPVLDGRACMLCFNCVRYCPTKALHFKLLPNADYFKGPRTLNGYVSPEEVLKRHEGD